MENGQVDQKDKTKSFIQAIGLLLLLVVLPLGSWYYLQSGLNYNKAAIAELVDYGQVPDFQLTDQKGEQFNRATISGKLVLASFFSTKNNNEADYFSILKELHEQFDDRNDIWFVQHSLNPESDTPESLTQYAEDMGFKDREQCWYLSGTSDQLYGLLRQHYKVPNAGLQKDEAGLVGFQNSFAQPLGEYPYFILIDPTGKIRNYYEYRDRSHMKRLVEHISLIMPRENARKNAK